VNARRPEPQASPVRGAILVVVAVVIGLVLIRNGVDTEVSARGGDSGANGESPDTSGDDTTSSTAALRPPAQVKVVVANASGVDGAAGSVTTTLQQGGYATGTATDAPATVATTAVYFVSGFDREAQAVATAIGGQPAIAQPMPTPPPIADTQGANVLVVLGPDLAPS
jgi:hypothetical protein